MALGRVLVTAAIRVVLVSSRYMEARSLVRAPPRRRAPRAVLLCLQRDAGPDYGWSAMVLGQANGATNRIVSFIWGIADGVLRDRFKRGKYPIVILPLCVIRRMDTVQEISADILAVENDAERLLDGLLKAGAQHG